MQDEFPTIPGERYIIEARLGKGGYGEVYRAEQVQIGRPVAIKLLHAHLAERSVIVRRFQREARLLSRLRHPNVVSVHDFHAESGLLYLVMEYLEGPNLREWARTHGPLSAMSVVEIMHRIVGGLRAVHEGGLIHRDLKPSNIIMAQIGGSLEPVLIDFGLAATESSNDEETALTLSEQLLGTPLYMSPEVIRGHAASAASDTYAAGVMLYEFIAGRVPFRGRRMMDTLRMHVHLPVPELESARGERLAPGLVDLVTSCLAKSPTDRPTIEELSTRLGGLIPGGPSRASTFGLARAALEQAVASAGTGESDAARSPTRRALGADALLAEDEPQGRTTILDTGAMHALLRGLLAPPAADDQREGPGSMTTILPPPEHASPREGVDTQAETVAWVDPVPPVTAVGEDDPGSPAAQDDASTEKLPAPFIPATEAPRPGSLMDGRSAGDVPAPAPRRSEPVASGRSRVLKVTAGLVAAIGVLFALAMVWSGPTSNDAGEGPALQASADVVAQEPGVSGHGATDAPAPPDPVPSPVQRTPELIPGDDGTLPDVESSAHRGALEAGQGPPDDAMVSPETPEGDDRPSDGTEAAVVAGMATTAPEAAPSEETPSLRSREDRSTRDRRRRDVGAPEAIVIDLPEEPGILSVNVSPWGDVWANGERLGPAPIRDRRVPAGRYVVRTRHGEGEQEEVVEVRPGERTVVLHVFRPGGSER